MAVGRSQCRGGEGREGAGCWVAAAGSTISLRQPAEVVGPSRSSALLACENGEKPPTGLG